MRPAIARYAVERFHELQKEHVALISAMGMRALKCLIRQRGMDSDNGWICHEVGIADDVDAFWGKFLENRGEVPKEILIVIDLEDVASIEFEIYDGKPVEA